MREVNRDNRISISLHDRNNKNHNNEGEDYGLAVNHVSGNGDLFGKVLEESENMRVE